MSRSEPTPPGILVTRMEVYVLVERPGTDYTDREVLASFDIGSDWVRSFDVFQEALEKLRQPLTGEILRPVDTGQGNQSCSR